MMQANAHTHTLSLSLSYTHTHTYTHTHNIQAGKGPAHCKNKLRLFGKTEKDVRVVLYRDDAGWCPYCQKVWLLLEEKQMPYRIEHINMRSYGEKPDWCVTYVRRVRVWRAAARRNAQKQPRVIRVGPNQGGKKLGPQYRGLSAKTHNTGVRQLLSLNSDPSQTAGREEQDPIGRAAARGLPRSCRAPLEVPEVSQ